MEISLANLMDRNIEFTGNLSRCIGFGSEKFEALDCRIRSKSLKFDI